MRCTVSHCHQQMQETTQLLNTVSTQLGFNINSNKTKIMKANTKNNNPITLEGEPLEETDSFTYQGSTIKKRKHRRRCQNKDKEGKSCIHLVKKNWRAKQIKINTKLRIFSSNVMAVLLNGSETWRNTQKTLKRTQTFINKCLR